MLTDPGSTRRRAETVCGWQLPGGWLETMLKSVK